MFDQLNRRGALIVIFLTAAIVGHPAVWASRLVEPPPNVDSFPISTYPMFASSVPDVYGIYHIVATGPGDREVRVPKNYWTLGGMNQARGQLDKAANAYRRSGRRDDSTLMRFCTKSAQRIARRKPGSAFDGTNKVRIVYSKYHLKDYFAGKDTSPVSRRVVLSCPIRRSEDHAAEVEQ